MLQLLYIHTFIQYNILKLSPAKDILNVVTFWWSLFSFILGTADLGKQLAFK